MKFNLQTLFEQAALLFASFVWTVVVLAGVLGSDGYLRTNERVEWMLGPGGVGQFVDLGKRIPMDLLVGDFNWPRKVDNTFAIGSIPVGKDHPALPPDNARHHALHDIKRTPGPCRNQLRCWTENMRARCCSRAEQVIERLLSVCLGAADVEIVPTA